MPRLPTFVFRSLMVLLCGAGPVALAQTTPSVDTLLVETQMGQEASVRVPLLMGMYLDKASWLLGSSAQNCYTAAARVGGSLELFNLPAAFAGALYSGNGQTAQAQNNPYSYVGELRWQDSRLTSPASSRLPALCTDRSLFSLFVSSVDGWTLSASYTGLNAANTLSLLGLRFPPSSPLPVSSSSLKMAAPEYLTPNRETVLLHGYGPSGGWLSGTLLQGVVLSPQTLPLSSQSLQLDFFLTNLNGK